eukprot:scaffold129948_cov33-Tisochrysis_lutea.AAC.2
MHNRKSAPLLTFGRTQTDLVTLRVAPLHQPLPSRSFLVLPPLSLLALGHSIHLRNFELHLPPLFEPPCGSRPQLCVHLFVLPPRLLDTLSFLETLEGGALGSRVKTSAIFACFRAASGGRVATRAGACPSSASFIDAWFRCASRHIDGTEPRVRQPSAHLLF